MFVCEELAFNAGALQTTYAKATKAELAKDYDSAYQQYIKAAESYLYLSAASTAQDHDKTRWRTTAKKAVERAEKIKKYVERTRNASSMTGDAGVDDASKAVAGLRLTPVGINHNSTRTFRCETFTFIAHC